MKHLTLFTILIAVGLSGCANIGSKKTSSSGSISRSDAWFSYNRNQPNIVETSSGLQYKVLEASTNNSCKPSRNATIQVHYDMRVQRSGEIVDSSFRRGVPSTFDLRQMIPAWREAIPMMSIGDAWQLYIPAKLAYGRKGIGGLVPENSVLISRVVLLEASNCK